jgi:hypothetical protein
MYAHGEKGHKCGAECKKPEHPAEHPKKSEHPEHPKN